MTDTSPASAAVSCTTAPAWPPPARCRDWHRATLRRPQRQAAMRAAGARHTHTPSTHAGLRRRRAVPCPKPWLAEPLPAADHYTGRGRADRPGAVRPVAHVQRRLGTSIPSRSSRANRCAATNDALRRGRGGGVATHSLHMDGRAIDVRLPGVRRGDLRDAALSLEAAASASTRASSSCTSTLTRAALVGRLATAAAARPGTPVRCPITPPSGRWMTTVAGAWPAAAGSGPGRISGRRVASLRSLRRLARWLAR